jgi:hypothetical protein
LGASASARQRWAVAGSLASFLVSGLFDDVVEPTRLATLFFLVCLCGLMQWEEVSSALVRTITNRPVRRGLPLTRRAGC